MSYPDFTRFMRDMTNDEETATAVIEAEAATHTTARAETLTWPAPLTDAFQGLAGDFVRLVEPQTESDPAAILFQFLATFGNLIGRTAHWRVEATQHFCNLFVCLVGDTAKGRKGTSGDRVRAAFKGLDPAWDSRIRSGLSSGEGLVWHVRDPIREMVPSKERGQPAVYSEQVTDAGESDKRALIIEPEFARVLQAVERHGNTLSPVVRDAWDSKPLGVLTKQQAAQCQEPHISILAHCTTEELRRLMSDVALANGFANRFMFPLVRRSKLLPYGGDEVDLDGLRVDLSAAVADAMRITDPVDFDIDARDIWAAAYAALSDSPRGLHGAVTARAEAQVRRLAVIYALLDSHRYVRPQHLSAAMDAWRYCSESAAVIFGGATGDRTVDALVEELRRSPAGATRTEIHHAFGRHKSAPEIGRALQELLKAGRVRCITTQTGGRPSERWILNSP